jgi:hypothetical protein
MRNAIVPLELFIVFLEFEVAMCVKCLQFSTTGRWVDPMCYIGHNSLCILTINVFQLQFLSSFLGLLNDSLH